MNKSALRPALPYFVGLAVAAALFVYTGQIAYTPRPGLLGPDFWPRLVICLMTAACLFEIVRIFAGLKADALGIGDAIEKDADETPAQSYPGLLLGGVALVIGYALVIDTLGFLLSSFLFLSAFMYLGRYRRHGMVWGVSGAITLTAALIFIRFAYVSLPRGTPPFDAITDFVRVMLGG
jgi:hypothetical protein